MSELLELLHSLRAPVTLHGAFALPIFFDLGAIFCFALTGAWAATHRGYDMVGAFVLAFVTGLGGALIRDSFLLGLEAAVLRDGRYLLVVLAATLIAGATFKLERRFVRLMAVVDALGLGAYAVVGMQKSIIAGLPPGAVLLVGVANAVGGGIMRDVIVRDEPLILKPGQVYALAALGGCLAFLVIVKFYRWEVEQAAWFSIGVTFLLRMLAIVFNWRTAPVSEGAVLRMSGERDPP
jgi:uncharacterized membrane protein YeiH